MSQLRLIAHDQDAACLQINTTGRGVDCRLSTQRDNRHSCAMHTLQATHDIRRVALWLGHARIQSIEIYLRADPTETPEALAAPRIPYLHQGRFRPPDALIELLRL